MAPIGGLCSKQCIQDGPLHEIPEMGIGSQPEKVLIDSDLSSYHISRPTPQRSVGARYLACGEPFSEGCIRADRTIPLLGKAHFNPVTKFSFGAGYPKTSS